MSARRLGSDVLRTLLLTVAGLFVGLSAGALSASRTVARLEMGTDGLVRAVDIGVIRAAGALLGGTAGLFLPVLILVLGLVVVAVALLSFLRGLERKLPAFLALGIGLVVGLLLTLPALLFSGAPARAEMALIAAGLGAGPVIRAAVWPRLLGWLLIGATIGWAAGAASSASWGRRVLLCLVAILPAAGAATVMILARPPLIEVPASAPQLATVEQPPEQTLWVIGGTNKAIPVTLTLSDVLTRDPAGETLAVNRRNVARARKAARVLPMLHPRSAAAERLVTAGKLADLDVVDAARWALKSFVRRGHRQDGMLAASLIGQLSPTPQAVALLKRATDPAKLVVGSRAAVHLCRLATATGEAEIIERLSCQGNASKSVTGQVKLKIYLKGRPLRRATVGLVAEPKAQQAPWVKQGKVVASAFPLVGGAPTKRRGEVTIENVLPGTYLLAVAPSHVPREAKTLDITEVVEVVVPEKGGLVDLGTIEVGGAKIDRRRRSVRARARRLAKLRRDAQQGDQGEEDDDEATSDEDEENDDEDEEDEDEEDDDEEDEDEEDEDEEDDDEGETKRPARPLPRTAKQFVAKIRPAGPNRVIVPEGFGTDLLAADASVIARAAAVVPVSTRAGRELGLKLRSIRSNGVIAALGFEEGDLIRSINGRRVEAPDDLVKLVEVLEKSRRIRVRVERERRQKVLRIDIDR